MYTSRAWQALPKYRRYCGSLHDHAACRPHRLPSRLFRRSALLTTDDERVSSGLDIKSNYTEADSKVAVEIRWMLLFRDVLQAPESVSLTLTISPEN